MMKMWWMVPSSAGVPNSTTFPAMLCFCITCFVARAADMDAMAIRLCPQACPIPGRASNPQTHQYLIIYTSNLNLTSPPPSFNLRAMNREQLTILSIKTHDFSLGTIFALSFSVIENSNKCRVNSTSLFLYFPALQCLEELY